MPPQLQIFTSGNGVKAIGLSPSAPTNKGSLSSTDSSGMTRSWNDSDDSSVDVCPQSKKRKEDIVQLQLSSPPTKRPEW
jgi:hypothetical protein